MPAYNFQTRFADLVQSGKKRQTIRQANRGAYPGATAYLFTGQRTKQCRKLGEGRVTGVWPIEIGRHACGEPYASILYSKLEYKNIVPSSHLVHSDLDKLAKEDGFTTGEEMVTWFEARYGLPFSGFLHQWEL